MAKTCHFSNIRCFLKLPFALKNSNAVEETIFVWFCLCEFLTKSDHFINAIAFA